VVSIEFSESGNYLAVGYDSRPRDKEERTLFKESEGSFVSVYAHRDHVAKSNTLALTKEEPHLFVKKYDIKCPVFESKSTNTNRLVPFCLVFSEDTRFLMVYFQPKRTGSTEVEIDEKDGVYVLWDVATNTSVNVKLWGSSDHKMETLRFPHHVYGHYSFIQDISRLYDRSDDTATLSAKLLRDLTNKQDNISVTAILEFESFVYLGDEQGNIHVIKSLALSYPKNEIPDKIDRRRLCQARSFAAHSSQVTQICLSSDYSYLITVAAEDECIMQWELQVANANWEFDHLAYDNAKGQPELKAAIAQAAEYELENLKQREELAIMKLKSAELSPDDIQIQLAKLIGRNGLKAKNNILITADDQLVFNAGSLLAITQLPRVGETITTNSPLVQHFVEPDSNKAFSTSPEITCITICKENKLVAAGTKQLTAQVIIWDIPTRSYLKKIPLSKATTVISLRFSESSSHIVALVHSEHYEQALYYLDVNSERIMGYCSFDYSHSYRIKELCFLPKTNCSFITCGIQHMSRWTYKGGMLNFEEFEMAYYKDRMGKMKADELQQRIDGIGNRHDEDLTPNKGEQVNVRVTLLCIVFVLDFCVVGGEDGEVG
jgi:WD40 repeat protein